MCGFISAWMEGETILGPIGLPELIIIVLGVSASAFWVWMLVDCATNESSGTEKIVWVLIILFGGCIGAPIYYFARRPRRIEELGR
jgi:hypothetical protein